MKRVRVFLGGFINYTNAQNLNCRSIANYLDSAKFEVYALTVYSGKRENFNLSTFNCFWPFSISRHIGFLWGIINSDIIYLPKHIDTPFWVLRCAKFLKKPVFTTIEGNVIDQDLPNLISLFGDTYKMQSYFKGIHKIFGITQHLINQTKKVINIEEKVLSLGVNLSGFVKRLPKNLSSVIFIGSLIQRKRVEEFLRLAACYPDISFHIIGDGPERNNLKRKATKNVIFHGFLEHIQMRLILKDIDLMFLPSKSEGFPKVILEVASAGIPSILYNTYGASEWIDHAFDGFIINDFEQVREVVRQLITDPVLLNYVSNNALKLAERYDWRNVIKDWEYVIDKLYNER